MSPKRATDCTPPCRQWRPGCSASPRSELGSVTCRSWGGCPGDAAWSSFMRRQGMPHAHSVWVPAIRPSPCRRRRSSLRQRLGSAGNGREPAILQLAFKGFRRETGRKGWLGAPGFEPGLAESGSGDGLCNPLLYREKIWLWDCVLLCPPTNGYNVTRQGTFRPTAATGIAIPLTNGVGQARSGLQLGPGVMGR